MSRGDDDFLSRWSRRKRAVAEEASAPASDPAPEPEESGAAAPPDEIPDETDEALLARLGLPDPDTLAAGDDFSRFMAAQVPERLRRRALRRLWRSNPTLAVLDGLNDYDDDFTGGFVAPGSLRTAYQVGRGIVARVEEASAEIAPEMKVATNPPDKNTQEVEPAEEAAPTVVTEGQGPSEKPEQKINQQAEDAERPPRRRMAFRIEGDA